MLLRRKSRERNNGGPRAVVEDDTKTPRLVKLEANQESAAMYFAQEKELCNRHKDEYMNAQENANMNEVLATNAMVHVMKHTELAISGATMETTRQLRDLLRRKRGREEEPTEFAPKCRNHAVFSAQGCRIRGTWQVLRLRRVSVCCGAFHSKTCAFRSPTVKTHLQ